MARKHVTDELVCEAADMFHREGALVGGRKARAPWEWLMRWTGQPYKVCLRAMERAEARGLLEYGVSLRTGWLSQAGRELLQKGVRG